MKTVHERRQWRIVVASAALFILQACSVSTFGKFQYESGVPSFIRVGETTRHEVFEKMGEPLVDRFVAGKETAIYNHEQGTFWFIYGTYEGHELIIRFDNQVVSEVKIEKTGAGWGWFAPANANNPARSAVRADKEYTQWSTRHSWSRWSDFC